MQTAMFGPKRRKTDLLFISLSRGATSTTPGRRSAWTPRPASRASTGRVSSCHETRGALSHEVGGVMVSDPARSTEPAPVDHGDQPALTPPSRRRGSRPLRHHPGRGSLRSPRENGRSRRYDAVPAPGSGFYREHRGGRPMQIEWDIETALRSGGTKRT